MVKEIRIKKIKFKELKNPAKVKKITSGNVISFVSMKVNPPEIPIRKLSGSEYLNLYTGEVNSYDKHDNKSDVCSLSIRRTMERIRNLLNANCLFESHLLWITLTYSDNMTDTNRLYSDFNIFWKKFKYRCKKENWSIPEYINVVEPQGRGAWHCHVMLIFPSNAPYIDNNTVIAKLWGHGFTKTKAVHGIDNIGAYFSAYLADMPLEDVELLRKQGVSVSGETIDKSIEDEITGKSIDKKFVKGARLAFYPAGMNIVRTSRGVARPIEEDISHLSSEELKKEKASSGKLTFSSAVEVVQTSDGFSSSFSSGSDSLNVITKEYYNIKRF